ncbi:Major facilitator superfamily MFS-1 domain containing protein [Aphelenchoides fujianensis]|nr:Major facilitator superfamily MFS-1 domain containing protein [Aphelenchoides fujianensis]
MVDEKCAPESRPSVQFERNTHNGLTRFFGGHTRFFMLVLVLLCLTSIWSNILAFNFALICHVDDTKTITPTSSPADDPRNSSDGPPNATDGRSRSPLPLLIANFGVVLWVNHHGIRVIFTVAGLLSALSTFLLPTAIKSGFYLTLFARDRSRQVGEEGNTQTFDCLGLAFATNFPVIGAFCSKWGVHSTKRNLAPTLTNPVSGTLCISRWKWPSVFYVHGLAGTIVFVAFALFFRNSPKKHPFVGTAELERIAEGKLAIEDKKETRKIPYVSILKTPAVWAVWVGAIGNFSAVNLMFLYGPTWVSRVLAFDVDHAGFLTAMAPLFMCSPAFLSDKIHFLGETNKLRMFNSISFLGGASFMCLLAFFPTAHPYAGGLVSKQYAHFVTGNISIAITTTMLIVPFIVNGIAPESTAHEWRWVFLLTASILVAANIVFMILCSAKAAWWTEDRRTSRQVAAFRAAARLEDARRSPRLNRVLCSRSRRVHSCLLSEDSRRAKKPPVGGDKKPRVVNSRPPSGRPKITARLLRFPFESERPSAAQSLHCSNFFLLLFELPASQFNLHLFDGYKWSQ